MCPALEHCGQADVADNQSRCGKMVILHDTGTWTPWFACLSAGGMLDGESTPHMACTVNHGTAEDTPANTDKPLDQNYGASKSYPRMMVLVTLATIDS